MDNALAEKIKTNIRELEGALIRVVAYAKLVGKNVSVDLAKEVLKDMLIEGEKKVTIELIQKKVSEYFDIKLSDMRAKAVSWNFGELRTARGIRSRTVRMMPFRRSRGRLKR